MGAATGWPSPTLTKMAANEAPVTLDTNQISWMVSLMFLGHITSPIPTGYLMDRYGRKKICLILSILPFSSWMLILFASSPLFLYIARFNAGLWIGVTTTVMPLYVGEIAVPSLRSSLTTINNLLLNFGVLFAYLIGPFVSYQNLAIACEGLTVVYFLLFLPMPESPYYFLKHDQYDKAFKALSWLREGESKESVEEALASMQKSVKELQEQKGSLKDIFYDKGNRKAFFISAFYSVFKRTSGSAVIQAYASVTLPMLTFSILDADMCVIIIGVISLVSSTMSTALAALFPRRVLLTVSCGGCALTTAAIMVWFFLNDKSNVDVTNYSDIVFISLALYYVVFNIGLGPVGTSIKGEMFSVNVKALSSSLTTLLVAFTGFLLNKFYLLIAQSAGMYVNYLVFSVSCIVSIIFTWIYVPETHNKTLEEIRLILRGDKRHKNYNST